MGRWDPKRLGCVLGRDVTRPAGPLLEINMKSMADGSTGEQPKQIF
jgi:hypothetical protein